jgi:hypothetical protein
MKLFDRIKENGRMPRKSAKVNRRTVRTKVPEKALEPPKNEPEPPKVEKAVPQGKYTKWVAEAIAALETAENAFVPFEKIKGYLCDYMSGEKAINIPKLAKRALAALVEGQWLTAKKDSYRFSRSGRGKLAPKSVERRKKIEPKTRALATAVSLVPKQIIVATGRISQETALES